MAQLSLLHSRALQTATVPTARKRSDIQGLRALAVIAVVLDHVLQWPTGGFVGVDVFFVISGFLITGLLLREHDKSGTISLKAFYLRRIRRILPAAATVLVLTSIAAYLLFNFARAQQTTMDAVWSFLFSANWHFAGVGTDYFQSSGPISPLQHFWSLSVEEQFYFVWPWLMLLIFFLDGRAAKWDKAHARRAIAILMSIIVAVSFAWAVLDTMISPTIAYFSTFTRAWELGVGALVAVFGSVFARIPNLVRITLAWVGLLGVFWSIFNISADMAFPAPWAAVPVLAAALVLIAGTGGTQRFLWPLTNRGAGYVGDISYSLYLWHFPAIVLLGSLIPEGTWLFTSVAMVVSVIAAVLTYHLIEKPVLGSRWLSGTPAPRSRRVSGGSMKAKVAALAALAMATAGITALALLPANVLYPAPSASAVAAAPNPRSVAVLEMTPEEEIYAGVSQGLASEEWPDFDPSIDDLMDLRAPQWTENGCLNVTRRNADLCIYGPANATKNAVVMGDSIGTSWLPGLVTALGAQGYKVHALTYESCPNAHVDIYPNAQIKQPYRECREHQTWAEQHVADMQPDLVVMSNSALSLNRLVSGKTAEAAYSEWKAGYILALEALPTNAKIVTLSPAPGAINLQSCYTPLSRPSNCIGDVSENWRILRNAEADASSDKGVHHIDTESWFCSGGRCPAAIDTTAVYTDSSHITRGYSEKLAPVMLRAFREVDVIS